MKDSQGTLIKIGDSLKSSVSPKCIPAIKMVEEGKFVKIHEWNAKPFLMNQQSMTNSKWIIAKDKEGIS